MNERFTIELNHQKSSNIRDQEGFQYNRFSQKPNMFGEIRWACQKRKQKGCKCYVKTIGNFIVAQKHYHTCI